MIFSFGLVNLNKKTGGDNVSDDRKRAGRPRVHEAGVVSQLQERTSVDDLWPDVEKYLVHAAHMIRTESTEMMERLKDVRHRMNWYAVIYTACGGSPQNSNKMYHNLALFLLNDLEVNVLRPFLQRGADGSSPATSMCQEFVQHYKLFMSFRRVVLSCFSYLDQYFTVKFRLDTITTLCVKLFYAVVYEPIKAELVREMIELADEARTAQLSGTVVSSPESVDVHQTLLVIVEILTTVKAASTWYQTNTKTVKQQDEEDMSSVCKYMRKLGGEGGDHSDSILSSILAELESMQQQQHVASIDGSPKTRNKINDTSGDGGQNSNNNSNRPGKQSSSTTTYRDYCNVGSEKRGSGAMSRILLDGISLLRVRLEKRSFIDPVGMHTIPNNNNRGRSSYNYNSNNSIGGNNDNNNNNNNNSAGVMSREGNVKPLLDSEGVCIAEITQPLQLVLCADFGVRYVRAAEAYYRNLREKQVSRAGGYFGYIEWAQECLVTEWALVRDVRAPLFLAALRERVHHVLLVEPRHMIILSKEFGFRALLDAWDSCTGGSAADVWKEAISSDSSVFPVKRNKTSLTGDDNNNDDTNASMYTTATELSSTLTGLEKPEHPWGELTREELGCRINTFFTLFLSTQDEACLALLASEFASKVLTAIAALFLVYMTQVKAIMTQQQHVKQSSSVVQESKDTTASVRNNRRSARGGVPSVAEFCTQQELTMGLVRDIVDASIQLCNFIHNVLDDHPSMLAAMRDAVREVINLERWEQTGGGIVGGGMYEHASPTTATSPLQNALLLDRDAVSKTQLVLHKLLNMRGSMEIPLPQLFALYCDQLCKRELDDCTTDRVKHIVDLITLLDDKDIFVEHYRLLLARRLLLLPSTEPNLDREHLILHRMHHALGRTLTYNLEAMLRDYEIIANTNDGFFQTESYMKLPAKLRVKVINAVHWPTYSVVPLAPCRSLMQGMNVFADYYVRTHPSRMLHWIHTLGTAVLHAVFPKGTKEVMANTLQSHVLILVSEAYNAKRSGVENTTISSSPFDSKEKSSSSSSVLCTHSRVGAISGRDIAAAMGMEFDDIYVYLFPLVQHKSYNLLTRVGPPRSNSDSTTFSTPLLPEDEFTLNVDYVHKLRKFKLPATRSTNAGSIHQRNHNHHHHSASSTENTIAAAADGISKEVEASRRVQLDAAIVRIMKSRRSLRYCELLELTVQQLSRHFSPQLRCVKSQVEDLVCRGFLRRSEEDSAVFEYIA